MLPDSQNSKLSRRDITKAGVMAAGAALASGAARGLNAQPRPYVDWIKWNYETDIICVGGGAAGLTAAVVAHSNGDDVILLEALPVLGGTTAKSGGVFWIPNNRVLREHGIEDTKSDCLRYMVRFGFPEFYVANHPTLGIPEDRYEMLSTYYDNAAAMVERLEKNGVFKAGLWDVAWLGRKPALSEIRIDRSQPDYGDNLAENLVKRGRCLCIYLEDGMLGGGMDFVSILEGYLRKARRRILLGYRVKELIQSSDGAVIGVGAEVDGQKVFVRARKAVIFGTGGYAHNMDLRMKYQRDRVYGTCAGAGSRGDLIPMASKAGAALGSMGSAWRADGVVEDALANGGTLGQSLWYPVGDSMIFVNKRGDRMVNEYRSYNSRAKTYLSYDATAEEYPNQLRFMIFDARTRELCAGKYPLPAEGFEAAHIISGDDIEKLAENIDQRLGKLAERIGGVRLEADFANRLTKTLERFNGFARSGIDEDFGRGKDQLDRDAAAYAFGGGAGAHKHEHLSNPTMYPIADRGPYYAVIIGMAVLDTNGGPVINTKGQVVDYDNNPIPGLYAAGNCCASPSGAESYLAAGATIGAAMTFAYLAANSAHEIATRS